jgi:four helix bundle protein
MRLREGVMYKSFKDMPVWIEAMDMAESIFRITSTLPKNEDYGLTSQLRRSALSVSGNIAEAFGRYHVKDKVNFYYYSRGSIAETMSHLEYGIRVGYFNPKDLHALQTSLSNLNESINILIKSLKDRFGSRPRSQSQP